MTVHYRYRVLSSDILEIFTSTPGPQPNRKGPYWYLLSFPDPDPTFVVKIVLLPLGPVSEARKLVWDQSFGFQRTPSTFEYGTSTVLVQFTTFWYPTLQRWTNTGLFVGFFNTASPVAPHIPQCRRVLGLYQGLLRLWHWQQCCGSETKVSDLISDPDPACS